MKQNVLDPKTYLPNHLIPITCWVSYERNEDARAQLLYAAHEAQSENVRREARVAMAKIEWAQSNLAEGDYLFRTYFTPLYELAIFHPEWYDEVCEIGASPSDLLHQVCITFDDALQCELFKAGTSEIY